MSQINLHSFWWSLVRGDDPLRTPEGLACCQTVHLESEQPTQLSEWIRWSGFNVKIRFAFPTRSGFSSDNKVCISYVPAVFDMTSILLLLNYLFDLPI